MSPLLFLLLLLLQSPDPVGAGCRQGPVQVGGAGGRGGQGWFLYSKVSYLYATFT